MSSNSLPDSPHPAVRDSHLTHWLRRWSGGDALAAEEVFRRVYDELRSIAARTLRGERRQLTLQPTALVHETFLRYSARSPVVWENREQFLAYSARIIRQILVDHARARQRLKRGDGAVHVCFGEGVVGEAPDVLPESHPVEILALHDALERLAQADPQKAAVVELRFFGGLTTDEIAEVLDISRITVLRQWRRARAWLFGELAPAFPAGS